MCGSVVQCVALLPCCSRVLVLLVLSFGYCLGGVLHVVTVSIYISSGFLSHSQKKPVLESGSGTLRSCVFVHGACIRVHAVDRSEPRGGFLAGAAIKQL